MFLGRFVAAHRTSLADAGLALVLAATTAVMAVNSFLAGSNNEKLVMRFGTVAAWQRAALIWWLFAGLCLAALVVQHRWPLAAAALAGFGAGSHLLDPRLGILALDLAAPITLYTLATLARARWIPWIAVTTEVLGTYVVTVAGSLVIDMRAPSYPGAKMTVPVRQVLGPTMLAVAAKGAFPYIIVLVLAFVLGTATRTRRAHLATLEQRAADLEREQDQRAALAIAAERARITRELHDVVAHGLSVMVVQAQGAAAAQGRHPERTAAALQHIIATGRASLAEMRRLLGVVRRDPADDPQLAPLPGIGALPALVDQIRAAGTPVHLDVEGEPVPLPAGVDLSAYRIVQEALTNTLKHAGPGARATVRLGFTADRLEVEIRDDGSGSPPSSTMDSGNGLRGIAERVDILGGELAAGPCAGGGFRVRALLPIEPEPVGATTT